MAPIVHCSGGNISLFPRTTFIPRKDVQLMRHDVPGRYMRPTSYCERLQLTQSSLRLFQIYRGGCGSNHGSRVRIVAAVGTDVAVEELNPDVSGKGVDETSDGSDSLETSETAAPTPAVATTTTARNKRQRPGRKSEMPPVKDEELVPGASFTGKVRSVQPFGAFIDIGAYTDGLVHVSRLTDGFVKEVGDVVSVGQEVKVYIVEVNQENGRISLTMLEGDDGSKAQQRKPPKSGSSDKPRPTRKSSERPGQKRGDVQKTSKLVKGQVLDGTVKKLTRAGAFVSLPDGEEGFLPISEESEGFGNISGNSSLTVGQEVNVRVLRFTRGNATLTMKKEEDIEGLNKQLSQGSVHVATNPFELAFRKNKGISSFLEERERLQKASENLSASKISEQTVEVDKIITKSDTPEVDGMAVVSDDDQIEVSVAGVVLEDEKITSEELHEETLSIDPVGTELVGSEEEPATSSGQNGNAALETSPEDKGSSETVTESSSDSVVDKVDDITATITEETSIKNNDKEAGESSSTTEENEEVPVSDSSDSVIVEESTVDAQSPEETEDQVLSSKSAVVEEVAAGQTDTTANKLMAETPTPLENEAASSKAEEVDVKIPEPADEQNVNPDEGSTNAVATISPALVKQLRDETGAGMMDCKNALSESGGDIIKAQELLRKKGLASADKKASRATAEGRVGSYVHDSRIGILIEVNCETDFVSRGEIFKELVDDLAMQVAACPQVRYLATEDVPEDFVSKEREIEMQKEDLLKKPEEIRSKIVDGRIRKRLEEFALLEQPYIKNDKLTVKDMVKQTIATIGENIKVNRFVRYNLGEGLEKKSQDFAAEVAAQTAAKSSPAPPKDEPTETKEIVEKPPTVAVSAALVKQLRDETGAGMMDCKKALAETGGDLEQAQEYLRKKGLSSADKKSSRLAAEGRISSYIHDSRIGVLIEVNSETDFVARNERFKELVDDLAMQVVACPQVEYVSVEDIPESIVNAEKEIEMQREDLKSKPENIRGKIVEGRISKRLGEISLLEQPFIKDDSLTVKDIVKQTVAALGENIKVRRFVRYTLGENIE